MGLALVGLVERWFHFVLLYVKDPLNLICRLDMYVLPEKIVFTVARFLINLREPIIVCLSIYIQVNACFHKVQWCLAIF